MKKFLKLFLVSIIASLSFIIKSEAASCSISVKASASQIVVGQSVKFTVTISSGSPLGSWNFDVGASGGIMTAGDGHIVDYASTTNQKSKSYSYTVKANAKGTITVSVRNSLVYGFDEAKMSVTNGSSSVKVITQAELEASYSNNNNLKLLSVEGQEISPSFDKDVLEYKVELAPDVEKINVIALKEDNSASIDGAGEIEVSEGDNRIEIKVTSQRGTLKTYVLIATVKDNNPITTKINNIDFVVVKKSASLSVPTAFEETTIMIGEQEVPGFYSSVANLYIVGLKDEQGNIILAVYDKKKNTFTKYNEIKSNSLVFYPIVKDSLYKELIKTTIKVNNENIEAYKFSKLSKFALIYGMNIETGKENWYMYDEVEQTFQIFNDEQIKDLKSINKTYLMTIFATLTALGVSLILIICLFLSKSKLKKIVKKKSVEEKLKESKKEKANE